MNNQEWREQARELQSRDRQESRLEPPPNLAKAPSIQARAVSRCRQLYPPSRSFCIAHDPYTRQDGALTNILGELDSLYKQLTGRRRSACSTHASRTPRRELDSACYLFERLLLWLAPRVHRANLIQRPHADGSIEAIRKSGGRLNEWGIREMLDYLRRIGYQVRPVVCAGDGRCQSLIHPISLTK